MFLPPFQDLVKPQWRSVLEELRRNGESSVSNIVRSIGGSYMAVKTHCEELTRSGYVLRTRLPRSAVGRPEILYSLTAKSATLFAEAGVDFSLGLLDDAKRLFGENAPEKLLFQYFERRREALSKSMDPARPLREQFQMLAGLRCKEHCESSCAFDSEGTPHLLEHHNPLGKIFSAYPRAIAMEQRMLEDLLGTKLHRREIPAGPNTSPGVSFSPA